MTNNTIFSYSNDLLLIQFRFKNIKIIINSLLGSKIDLQENIIYYYVHIVGQGHTRLKYQRVNLT